MPTHSPKLQGEPSAGFAWVIINQSISPAFEKLLGRLSEQLGPGLLLTHLVHIGACREDSWVTKSLTRANALALRDAEVIVTLSEGMARTLERQMGQDGPRRPISVIPNWADTDSLRPLPKANSAFAAEYGQIDKLTVLYSGNMGADHALRGVIEAVGSAVFALPSAKTDLGQFIVTHDVGEVHSPEDAPALAVGLKKLADAPERLKEMRENARRLAVERYSEESVHSALTENALSLCDAALGLLTTVARPTRRVLPRTARKESNALYAQIRLVAVKFAGPSAHPRVLRHSCRMHAHSKASRRSTRISIGFGVICAYPSPLLRSWFALAAMIESTRTAVRRVERDRATAALQVVEHIPRAAEPPRAAAAWVAIRRAAEQARNGEAAVGPGPSSAKWSTGSSHTVRSGNLGRSPWTPSRLQRSRSNSRSRHAH